MRLTERTVLLYFNANNICGLGLPFVYDLVSSVADSERPTFVETTWKTALLRCDSMRGGGGHTYIVGLAIQKALTVGRAPHFWWIHPWSRCGKLCLCQQS